MKKLNLCYLEKNRKLSDKQMAELRGGEPGGGTGCNIFGCYCYCCDNDKCSSKCNKVACSDRHKANDPD